MEPREEAGVYMSCTAPVSRSMAWKPEGGREGGWEGGGRREEGGKRKEEFRSGWREEESGRESKGVIKCYHSVK